MRRRFLLGFSWIVLFGLLAGAVAPAHAAQPGPAQERNAEPAERGRGKAGERVPGRYIVTLRDDVLSGQAVSTLRRRHNVAVDRVFDRALRGFSAKLTAEQVRALEADPTVLRVEPDVWRVAHDTALPTGVDRIGADSTTNGVAPTQPGNPVAVLDTGVANHPDLNRAGGYNCTSSNRSAFGDRYGHGTHVAGTIGGSGGIAGVAPGTPIYAVKVLDDDGYGWDSWIICGLNWVLDHHDEYGIVAVNLSLGGPDDESASNCASSGLHQAVCNVRQAGVRVVVSAGNDNENAAGFSPAKYSQVITVAALADYDGCAGGQAGRRDDRKASWSNFGSVVDIIAPGASIVSTVPYGDGYDSYSGTSMAAPHITGAIALGWDPATGRRKLGIAGFGPNLGLVELSGNVTCLNGVPNEPTAQPRITVQPRTAELGERVRVKLRGYRPGEAIRILLNGRQVDLVSVDANGSGTSRIRVPRGTDRNRYVVRGIGSAGSSDSVRLRIRD